VLCVGEGERIEYVCVVRERVLWEIVSFVTHAFHPSLCARRGMMPRGVELRTKAQRRGMMPRGVGMRTSAHEEGRRHAESG
jgi:hypothetical protein